ncbi:MAG: glycoside hydrolase family 68 protein [Novosphingobium sp.]|nr:glycoside hydrolase family 68 protein [Novosphingobium sp.]
MGLHSGVGGGSIATGAGILGTITERIAGVLWPIATLRWTADSAAAAGSRPRDFALILPAQVPSPISALTVWDAWPLLTEAGGVYRQPPGGQLWFALAAPRLADPDARHAHARIHLLRRSGDTFEALGPAFLEGFTPGSREWSGSASIDAADRVTLRFTAAGRRGETALTFEQRLFESRGVLGEDGRIADWTTPREILAADDVLYRRADQAEGEIGKIKAFRDPEFFRDPGGAGDFLTFTASSAATPGEFDGLVGLARARGDGAAEPLAPLVDASGFNNELERPHLRVFDGRYYLFWSTQTHVFAPGTGSWPTGLYGAIADELAGPWRLLNGSGLVAANPPAAPQQAYSWLVLPDGSVTSFVDRWAAQGEPAFIGAFAPFARLQFDGDRVTLADG